MTPKAAVGSIETSVKSRRAAAALAIATAMLLGGCAGQATDMLPGMLASAPQAPSADAPEAVSNRSELEKATEYWGKKFAADPSSLENALSYARNLKAMGQKRQALPVLQQASVYHGQSKELANEYGRLALELDQLSTAKPLLALADDPSKPDWRVISARGTLLAKEGNYKDAIPYYERALALSNNSPSVMSNLAMAHALNGDAERSEDLLRRAAERGGNAKVRQNLALVLGLQGKYAESTSVGTRDLAAPNAAADTALVRQMVRLPEKSMPAGMPAATTAVASNTPAARPASFRPTAAPEPSNPGSWAPQVAAANDGGANGAKPQR